MDDAVLGAGYEARIGTVRSKEKVHPGLRDGFRGLGLMSIDPRRRAGPGSQ